METQILHIATSAKKKLLQPAWYAVYTRPRHEKKVFRQFQQECIEAYLPLRTTIRKWSDRKKKISEPFFSCYLFVNITQKDYHKVLNVPGVVRYVAFEGKAVTIPDMQISLIKNLLQEDYETVEYNERISAGTKVRIVAGPLAGIDGVLIFHSGKRRVIVRIEEIDKSLLINVPLKILKSLE